MKRFNTRSMRDGERQGDERTRIAAMGAATRAKARTESIHFRAIEISYLENYERRGGRGS